MKKIILGFICFCMMTGMMACSPKPEVTLLSSLEAIEAIMRENMESPDKLIAQLNAYAEAQQPQWEQMNRTFEAMNRDDYMRIIDHHQEQVRNTMLKIMDLDLEFQDQIKTDSVRMAAYMAAVNKIGAVYPNGNLHD